MSKVKEKEEELPEWVKDGSGPEKEVEPERASMLDDREYMFAVNLRVECLRISAGASKPNIEQAEKLFRYALSGKVIS
jgi:hypothetical protein